MLNDLIPEVRAIVAQQRLGWAKSSVPDKNTVCSDASACGVGRDELTEVCECVFVDEAVSGTGKASTEVQEVDHQHLFALNRDTVRGPSALNQL
ncbi:hypothetical protein CCR75_005825 [Bremia lactucae]|uniref:Uncharacterized protein n=1 Tax=Bremia lactucae TaxID=4779 RepID=A0A976IEH3_BRELC|nr:hypothetical protein CCR75_005825 [Bremia lactucae]